MADMNIKDAPAMTKIGLLSCLIGLLLHIIGFATTSWYDYDNTLPVHHVGLWADCYGHSCNSFFYKSGNLQAAEAFETIGLIVAILAVGAFLYWSFVVNVPPRSGLNKIMVAGLGSAALSIFIGDIIFGVSVIPNDLNVAAAYSFILTIIGGVGLALGAILLFNQLITTASDEDSERQLLRNSESKQHQHDPNCSQDGASSNQPSNARQFPSSAGYPDLNKELPDMAQRGGTNGDHGWTTTPSQTQSPNGNSKTSFANSQNFDSASVSQDENDLLATMPGALDPTSTSGDSKTVEINRNDRSDNNSMLNKIL